MDFFVGEDLGGRFGVHGAEDHIGLSGHTHAFVGSLDEIIHCLLNISTSLNIQTIQFIRREFLLILYSRTNQ